jgi:hypothetical protein
MRLSTRLGLTALVAALLLAAAIGTASARNLSVSNQSFRVTWSRLDFEGRLGIPTQCQVTLEGSFHSRTIAKVLRALIGAITRAAVKTESCTGGRATISGTPWHVTYQGFTGTLPNITAIVIALERYRFIIERPAELSPTCSYGNSTDSTQGSVALNTSGEATTLTPVAGRNVATLIEARNEEFFGRCPSAGELSGASTSLTLLGTTTRIRVTLI